MLPWYLWLLMGVSTALQVFSTFRIPDFLAIRFGAVLERDWDLYTLVVRWSCYLAPVFSITTIVLMLLQYNRGGTLVEDIMIALELCSFIVYIGLRKVQKKEIFGPGNILSQFRISSFKPTSRAMSEASLAIFGWLPCLFWVETILVVLVFGESEESARQVLIFLVNLVLAYATAAQLLMLVNIVDIIRDWVPRYHNYRASVIISQVLGFSSVAFSWLGLLGAYDSLWYSPPMFYLFIFGLLALIGYFVSAKIGIYPDGRVVSVSEIVTSLRTYFGLDDHKYDEIWSIVVFGVLPLISLVSVLWLRFTGQ